MAETGFDIAQDLNWKTRLSWPDNCLLEETASLVRESEDIGDALGRVAGRLGFDFFSLVHTQARRSRDSKPATVMHSNYPDSWKERYEAEGYLGHDPLVALGESARVPFLWGQDRNAPTSLADRIWSEGRSFQIRFGFSIPIHGPGGESTLFTLVTRHNPDTFRELVGHNYNLLWMISPLVHAAASTAPAAAVAPPVDKVLLTDQERICLEWTLRGKSSWEISRIISRSTSTVEYHLQKTMRKFGVNTKLEAAVKALKAGSVQP